MAFHEGDCDSRISSDGRCTCPVSSGHKAKFNGGTFSATVIVDEGRRGDVVILIDGSRFVVRGGLADGLRSLGVEWQ
jgi:hypothetical protein